MSEIDENQDSKNKIRECILEYTNIGKNMNPNFRYIPKMSNTVVFSYHFACIHDLEFFFTPTNGSCYNSICLNNDTRTWDLDNLVINIQETPLPVSIYFVAHDINGDKNMGHITILIFVKNKNTIYHYDSNGEETHIEEFLVDSGVEKCFLGNKLKQLLNKKLPEILFVSSKEIHDVDDCITREYDDNTSYIVGFNPDTKLGENENGYCQIWSLFMMNMVLKFQNVDIRDIINEIYINRWEFDGDNFAAKLIRGFYLDSFRKIRDNLKQFNKTVSIRDIQEFDTDNSLELLEFILSEMNDFLMPNQIPISIMDHLKPPTRVLGEFF